MTNRMRIAGSLALSTCSVLTCIIASDLTAAHHLAPLIIAYLALGAMALGLFLLLPFHASPSRIALWILLPALLARIALTPHEPSDDVNRYLWEGRLVAEGVNPYAHAPNDTALAEFAEGDPWHAGINHADMSAAYPPLVLGIFSLLYRIHYHPLAVKALVVFFDMLAVVFLLGILHDRRLPLRWAVLYSLNPLILMAFAAEGHFDALQSAFLLGTIWCHGRGKWVWMFLLAGAAVQTKYVAVLALPFFITRRNWHWSWVCAIAMAAPFLPVLALGDGPGCFDCLFKFGSKFAFNGPIHAFLQAATGSMNTATSITSATLALVLLSSGVLYLPLWNRRVHGDPLPGITLALSAALLLSPTVHYWYLAWILPIAVIRPGWPWLVASLTSVAYFAVPHRYAVTGVWEITATELSIQWLPLLALALLGAIRAIKHLAYGGFEPIAETLSVIIPTLNEVDHVGNCCKALKQNPAISQVIVADGGSTDATISHAEAYGALVIRHDPTDSPGRGDQVRAGLAHATGDVIAVVHADTVVPAQGWRAILDVLRHNPLVVGGSLGSHFEGGRLGVVEILNDFRAACLSLPFGDQVQFFRSRPVIQHDLFPSMPLMEDVELGLRLKGIGHTVHLFGDARVSPRSWATHKWKRAAVVIRLVAAYLLHRLRGTVDTRAMYNHYYQTDA